jgi:predicted nucleotidyltransferase
VTDELIHTLREIVARLEALEIAYMLVGSVAALAHGRSRSTQDFDLVIEADASAVRDLVRSLPDERFYASEDAAIEALRHQTQFNVIDMETGWKIDLIPRKARRFSEIEFSRRTRIDVLGLPIFVASLEDTIVSKLEWAQAAGGSERQLEDVRALLQLGGERVDLQYVRHWVEALALETMWSKAAEDD